MKEHSEYHIKYLGIEYIIQIYTIEDIYYYSIKYPGNFEISDNGQIFTNIPDCLNSAIEEICDDDKEGFKILMRDIKLDEILNPF